MPRDSKVFNFALQADQNPRVRIGFACDAPRQCPRGAQGHPICHVQAASQPTRRGLHGGFGQTEGRLALMPPKPSSAAVSSGMKDKRLCHLLRIVKGFQS